MVVELVGSGDEVCAVFEAVVEDDDDACSCRAWRFEAYGAEVSGWGFEICFQFFGCMGRRSLAPMGREQLGFIHEVVAAQEDDSGTAMTVSLPLRHIQPCRRRF